MDKQQELIDAAQALIDRWYTTDWKAEATATFIARLRDAVDALSEPAKPELPQDVESRALETAKSLVLDNGWPRGCEIPYAAVVSLIQGALTTSEAAHAAELAAVTEQRDSNGRACDKLIKRLDREGVKLREIQKERDHYAIELTNSLEREAQAKEQGRREALQAVPVDAVSHAAFVILHCDCGECDKYREPLDRFLDSARASQEVGNG